MIPVRIFISGNEERAKWHLPVVEAKFRSFVLNCQRRGLKQNSFQLNFEEDGTIAEGQYHYGTGSIQIYSPVKITTIQEESKDDLSVEAKPKTFWVNTAKGYYWVEVRYTDGVPRVILTAFNGQGEDGTFTYPGLGTASPGMIAGNFDDTAETRYVLTQDGVVLTGAEEEKGTISSTEIINSGRITPVTTVGYVHEYVLILQNGGQTTEVRRIKISYVDSEISITREYASLNMSLEGETFPPEVLNTLPAWVHRKCTGSYFSPNKTIGYHVDIGTDDDFMGNIFAARGLDLLDNTGGFEESLFNHTWDLYRIAGMLSFPTSVTDNKVSFYAVSPTMGFDDDPENSQKCWGGYELTIDWCGCADYRGDFSSWFLAPRIILVTVDLSTGEFTFTDESKYSTIRKTVDVFSWDEKFQGTFVLKTETLCNNNFYTDSGSEGDSCTWSEECSYNCDSVLGFPSTGECAKIQQPMIHWLYYFRENIKITRHAVFIFGKETEYISEIETFPGYYFLFDGLWHLDVGVLWTTMPLSGEQCAICSYPQTGQNPGELVYFSVHANEEWIMAHGHEYVENLNIVTPLGYHTMPHAGGGSSERLGFIAEVPEELDAPTPPTTCVGGVSYPSSVAEGETVFCERRIASRPCICTEMAWDAYATLGLNGVYHVFFSGGCPPFNWVTSGCVLKDYYGNTLSRLELEHSRSAYAHTGECFASVSVFDVCRNTLEKSVSYNHPTGVVSGPQILQPGQEAFYSHNLGSRAEYLGLLELVELGNTGALLRAPSGYGGQTGTVNFRTDYCGGNTATLIVGVGEYCPYPTSGSGEGYPGMLVSSEDRLRCGQTEGTLCNSHTCINYNDCPHNVTEKTWHMGLSSLSWTVGELSSTVGRTPLVNWVYPGGSPCRASSQYWYDAGMCGWRSRTIWVKE